MIKFLNILLILLSLSLPLASTVAQEGGNDIFSADDDDLNIGGDIFTDFNEDIENSKIVEDERFYRYGRFFSFNASLGLTTFDGNRGNAYENLPPTFGISFTFFKDFQSALNLGINFSKHAMFFKDKIKGFPSFSEGPGAIDVSLLRVHIGYRSYIDTSNLGTAITYSNPYLTGQFEYWYQTNKFAQQTELPSEKGGGIGFGLGFGLEFPVEIKESYVGFEFLMHMVNFPDKNTTAYIPDQADGYGFKNLNGNAYTTMLSYVFNW